MTVFPAMLGILKVIILVVVVAKWTEAGPQGLSSVEVEEILQQISGNIGEYGNIEIINIVPSILVYETHIQQQQTTPRPTGSSYSGGGGVPSNKISKNAAKSLLGAG